MEAPPPHADGRVDTHEDEEWPTEKLVEDKFGVDVCGDPALSPLLGHEVEKVVGALEGVGCFGGFGFGGCTIELRDCSRFFRVFLGFSGRGTGWGRDGEVSISVTFSKVEVGEAVVLDEISGYCVLSSTDS